MPRSRPLQIALALWFAHGAADAATVQHSEPLRGYRAGTESAKPAAAQPTTLHFSAFSRDFALELEPNGRLTSMQQQLGLSAGAAYRGKIAGRPGSWARVVLTPAGPTGLVFDGETLYGLEAGADKSGGGADNGAVMFRLADVYFAPGEIGSEHDAVAIDGEQAVAVMAEQLAALAATGASLNLDLGAVADFEFSQAFGSSAETALLARFNNVDGIFSEQLGVQVTVAETRIFTTSNDPFTTSVASDLLDEVATYRGATPEQDAQGLTHLFTGRDLDGSTAGIAFFGSVCAQRNRFDARSFGAGLSEARRGAVIDSLVAAHEIGHNFGAPHDGEANGACAASPPTFLMAPNINGSDRFSTCSIERIQLEIATASCLTPIGPADVAVTLLQPTQSALAGVSFSRTATIINQGADPATGVTMTAATEQGLDIVGVEAGDATCTAAPNLASCPLGSIAGSSSRTVTLTLRAQSPGTFDLTAAVAADADVDPSDNDRAVTVTAVPAVDLAWSGSGPQVALAAQATVSALLENASDTAATSVAVTATWAAGLRPDQATLGGTACTVAAQRISCPTQALAARTSVTLAVTATGLTVGSQSLTIGVSASEAELTPANNELALTVTVTPPPQQPSDDGSGGGASSWWLVAALLAALGGRRRPLPPTPSEG